MLDVVVALICKLLRLGRTINGRATEAAVLKALEAIETAALVADVEPSETEVLDSGNLTRLRGGGHE